MKLKEALEIGIDCGLETARECIRNIDIHATSFFSYSEISKEIDELYNEVEELVSKTNWTMDNQAEDLLTWIQSKCGQEELCQ